MGKTNIVRGATSKLIPTSKIKSMHTVIVKRTVGIAHYVENEIIHN
jgi:hypothetical protein